MILVYYSISDTASSCDQGSLSERNSGRGNYRKTGGIQTYLTIWGSYDPIESDPSEPEKGGLFRCSVKNGDLWAKDQSWWPPRSPPRNTVDTNKLSFWCPVMSVPKHLTDAQKS